MPSTNSGELLATWKIGKQPLQCGSYPTSGRKSKGQLAYQTNRLHLYPYFNKALQHSYESRVRNTIAHYIRAFRFPTGEKHNDQINLDIFDGKVLRLRIAYLYWVSLHTGQPDRKFKSTFTGLYDEYGKFSL